MTLIKTLLFWTGVATGALFLLHLCPVPLSAFSPASFALAAVAVCSVSAKAA